LLINFYDDKLCKGPMSTKLTRPQPTRLSCVGAMLQAFHKFQSKSKTIPELKSALQQIWDELPQTTINKAINNFRKHRVRFGRWWTFWALLCELGGRA